MLASVSWLRDLCPVKDQVRDIAAVFTARGLTVDAVTPAGADHVLEIDIPANRPDCLGHLGLARELSAASGVPLRPSAAAEPRGGTVTQMVRVEIEDTKRCARYTARVVRNVHVGPSPPWVVERLEACGLRSISNVVDASNLVLLELGNPIHFFDLGRLEGARIVIRPAQEGERLTTLDGVLRTLDPETLVIADARRPVALAGVMGGADSEIGERTRDVLIEAAWFQPRSVRRTARRLGVQTDASYRFERGVDPAGMDAAQTLAVRLLHELAQGQPVPGLIDVGPSPPEPRRLELRPDQLSRLLGYEPDEREVLSTLEALQLGPRRSDGAPYEVSVPSWRVDLEREVDLVEEVARHLGYDRIPTGQHGLPQVAADPARPDLQERCGDILAQLGFHEAFGYAMIARDEDAGFVTPKTTTALELTNPITGSLTQLRRSILPGLIRAVDLNQRRGIRDVRLFETGRVFEPQRKAGFPHESRRVGVAWSGAARPRHWDGNPNETDLYDVMGLVEKLFCELRPGLTATRSAEAPSGLHPGCSVAWKLDSGREAAWAGMLHPDLQRGLAHRLWLAEIDLEALEDTPPEPCRYRPVPRLTAVSRDLSLVMSEATPYRRAVDTMTEVEAPAPVVFEVVDRYEGPPLAAGNHSLTVRVTLQPDERTLTEDEIEAYRQKLVRRLDRKLGIKIRASVQPKRAKIDRRR